MRDCLFFSIYLDVEKKESSCMRFNSTEKYDDKMNNASLVFKPNKFITPSQDVSLEEKSSLNAQKCTEYDMCTGLRLGDFLSVYHLTSYYIV